MNDRTVWLTWAIFGLTYSGLALGKVPGLRTDRAGGDTKTPRSLRTLKLAQMAVGALREWQVDQAAERGAAGSRWQDTGRVFTTATGTPLGARHIRKMFQDVCGRAGFGRDWRLGTCGTRSSQQHRLLLLPGGVVYGRAGGSRTG